ncbi:hypothetical protein [Mycobacterium aquaticum]|uniref:hypothetical protein n=1 Tax=Mycobacterium aquaticum TaxID=1927124 RepID=UPI001B801FC3|nr:hypothetical protein [Mycobacterium aquaticum]
MRVTVIAAASAIVAATIAAPQANAGPQTCNDAFCVPGIDGNAELGAPCANTSYYVFGVDGRNGWGRLLFCGSPRRYDPRWFRSPPMAGIRDEGSLCTTEMDQVAQAPDGLFLTCVPMNGDSRWRRGDA